MPATVQECQVHVSWNDGRTWGQGRRKGLAPVTASRGEPFHQDTPTPQPTSCSHSSQTQPLPGCASFFSAFLGYAKETPQRHEDLLQTHEGYSYLLWASLTLEPPLVWWPLERVIFIYHPRYRGHFVHFGRERSTKLAFSRASRGATSELGTAAAAVSPNICPGPLGLRRRWGTKTFWLRAYFFTTFSNPRLCVLGAQIFL